jgi:hypothetical protein
MAASILAFTAVSMLAFGSRLLYVRKSMVDMKNAKRKTAKAA